MIRSNRESGANHAARANHPGNYHQPKSRQLMKNQIYDQKYFKVLPNSPNFYFFHLCKSCWCLFSTVFSFAINCFRLKFLYDNKYLKRNFQVVLTYKI